MCKVNRLVLGALLFCMSWSTASAAEYCVGSVAELDAALTDAVSSSTALFTTTIRLQQGTYHVGGSRMTQPGQANFHALELLGGYNSGCTTRTVNPDNTVLDADGATIFQFTPLGELVIEGIRFQNLAGYRQVAITSAADDLTVRVRNNAFVDVGVDITTGNSFDGFFAYFLNNRVHGYPGIPATARGAVSMLKLTRIRFTGNTIANNQNLGNGGAVDICINGSGTDIWLVDNIAWNNGGLDFNVIDDCSSSDNEPGQARSRSNLYQSVSLIEVGDSGSNLVGNDPLFVSAGSGNYRLQTASPAVNSGVVSSSMAEIDLDGNPRVVGSTVDRGAYESSFDDTIPATLTVTTASDSGPGSLRQTIIDANVNTDFNYINFNIPGACPRIIVPTSADLPAIVNGVRIDGWTQPGSVANTRTKGDNATRCIVLHGGGGRTVGLRFSGSSNEQFWVQGLAFAGFSPGGGAGEALRLVGGGNNIVWGNQFGAQLSSAAGSLVLSPSDTNIVLTGFSSSTVGGESPAHRNVIADANANGILVTKDAFFSSNDNDIVNNLIGSYGLEISAAANLGHGIMIRTSGNTVRDNTLIYNAGDGVRLDTEDAHHNLLQDNRIGARDTICVGDFCFGGPAGNGIDGITLTYGTHDNIIYNNVIRNNTYSGIFIASSNVAGVSSRNWLIANALYLNGTTGTSFSLYNGADNDAAASNQEMANRGLNYPVITRAYGGTRKGWVEGTLATTNGSYSLDVFSSTEADDQPRGEAERFHRSFYSVNINNAPSGQNGNASFRVSFTGGTLQSLAGRVVTVTAADNVGNTSELSAPAAYLCDVIYAQAFDDVSDDRCP